MKGLKRGGKTIIRVPEQLVQRYAAVLECRGIPAEKRTYYIMWLRFYLDFCSKYSIKGSEAGRLKEKSETNRQNKSYKNDNNYQYIGQTKADLTRLPPVEIRLFSKVPYCQTIRESLPNRARRNNLRRIQRGLRPAFFFRKTPLPSQARITAKSHAAQQILFRRLTNRPAGAGHAPAVSLVGRGTPGAGWNDPKQKNEKP